MPSERSGFPDATAIHSLTVLHVAKLAISIARKLGSLIFLTPEDIVERRAKLVMTFVGRYVFVLQVPENSADTMRNSLMALQLS